MRQIWNSRKRLIAISCFLLIVHIVLRCAHGLYEHYTNGNDDDDTITTWDHSFANDIDNAFESLRYMEQLKLGNAEIGAVVEKEKAINHYWWQCYLTVPTKLNALNQWIENDEFFIYSATYDDRYNSLYPQNHVVQVLMVSHRSIARAAPLFCNLYDLERGQYAVVAASTREIWQRAWDPRDSFYVPNLISCPVPAYLQAARNLTVSLSRRPCRSATVAMSVRKVRKKVAQKRGIAVCVKGMDYLLDRPERLIEWIEMQLLCGADAITVYTYYVPPMMRTVLQYYQANGVVTVVPIELPGQSPNHSYVRSRFIWRNRQQKRRHELIPYNDCFYRHIDTHEFILILDIDEVVVPLKHSSWSTMLADAAAANDDGGAQKLDFTSLSVLNAFKFPSANSSGAPPFMFMLNNRRISAKISEPGVYGKAFISTKSVATVFNHFALHRLHAHVKPTIYVNEELALKLHYKEQCPVESGKECELLQKVTLDDPRLDRFAEQWTSRVLAVLKRLALVNDGWSEESDRRVVVRSF